MFAFTVTDGDGDTATGSADHQRQRRHAGCEHGDGPSPADDEGKTPFPAQSNPAGRATLPNASTATGVAGTLFTAGADGLVDHVHT